MRWSFCRAWILGVLAVVTLGGCSDDPVHSEEECRAAGGEVVPAPGPAAKCPSGKDQIGAFPFGIEGAICCK